jgi:hypothetical protein
MEVKGGGSVFRERLNDVQYYLMQRGGATYGLFLRHAIVVPSLCRIAGSLPMASGINREGLLLMKLHTPTFLETPVHLMSEMVKAAALPLVFGHLGSLRSELSRIYGRHVFDIASQIVVRRYVETKNLEKYGFKIPGEGDFQIYYGMGHSIRKLCEILKKTDDNGSPMDRRRDLVDIFRGIGDISFHDKSPTDMDTRPIKPRRGTHDPIQLIWGVIEEGPPCQTNDLRVLTQIDKIKREGAMLKETSIVTSNDDRAWSSSEYASHVNQVRRKSSMVWTMKLRAMESKYRSHIREPSLLRPSRRHPMHKGRIRKSSLLVWFGVDTSGSMGQDRLELVDAELKAIHARDAHIKVLHIDAGVNKIEDYDPHKGLTRFVGRGGTDFSPFLMQLRQTPRAARPSFMAFYTDGYGCIGRYLSTIKAELGLSDIQLKERARKWGTRTPEGIEILWMLVEGARTLGDFRYDVPFGRVVQVPLAKRSEDG